MREMDREALLRQLDGPFLSLHLDERKPGLLRPAGRDFTDADLSGCALERAVTEGAVFSGAKRSQAA